MQGNINGYREGVFIFYQNVRGLRTKIDELFLATSDCNHDIIILTETGLNDCIYDAQLFGTTFNVFRCDRSASNSCKTRFGGVLIAVKSCYSSKVVYTINGHGLEQICVSCAVKGKNLWICAVYIPPDRSNDASIINNHVASVDELRAKASFEDVLLVCGDFNQPRMRWTKDINGIYCENRCTLSTTSCSLLDGMDYLNLSQANLVRNSLDRTLDLVFHTSDLEIDVTISSAPFLPVDIYHPPLIITLPAATVCHESIERVNVDQLPNYRKIDFTALSEYLSNVNWMSILADVNSNDVDNMADAFSEVIRTWLLTNVPRKRAAVTPVWSTPRLRELKRRRNCFQRRLRCQRTEDAKRNFRNSSNAYRHLNTALYKSYVVRIQSSLRRNPKNFWSFVNSKRKSSSIPTNVFFNETSSDSAVTSSELFARHFASVFAPICSTQYEAELATSDVPADIVDVDTFVITPELVTTAAKRLKCSYSPGPDGIPAVVLHRCIVSLAEPLCYIFNRSFVQGKFPSIWKQSFMFPVFKHGDRRNVKNYRGITSLSAASKLFEIIVSGYVLQRTKSYISDDQHGFMPGRSVSTNLLQFTSMCIRQFEAKAQIDVVYTDLKAAFDKIDHRILLCKLSRLGFSTQLVSWLHSYLSDRTLRVSVDSCISHPFSNLSGVPQGSNFGPLLFTLFFNDAALILGDGCKLIYADDLKLYAVVRSVEDCKRLQDLLDKFVSWCRRNKLIISIDKCNVITFHRIQKPIVFNYYIDGELLSRVHQVNDLGLILDTKLTFDLHRSSIISKASRQLGFIGKIAKEFTDPHCLKSLYCALVRPILETASVVWCPYQITWSLRIERVQKRFIRLALRNLPWRNPLDLPPYPDRCRLLELDTLQRRRNIQQMQLIAKILNGDIDSSWLLSRMDIRAPSRNLRSDTLLQPSAHRTSYGFHEPIAACVRAFNLVDFLYNFDEPTCRFADKIRRFLL